MKIAIIGTGNMERMLGLLRAEQRPPAVRRRLPERIEAKSR